jgi:hypothetical protein
MMTYEWFKITQQKHIKDVELPNIMYHPYKEEGYSFLRFLQVNWEKYPIFLCGGYYHEEPAVLNGYALWPHGFCDRITLSRTIEPYKGDMLEWFEYSKTLLPSHMGPPDMTKYTEDSWEAVVYTDYWACIHKMLYHLLVIAIEQNNDQSLLEHCAVEYDALVARHPNPPDHLYKNQGVVWSRLYKPEAKARYIAAFKSFLKVAQPGSMTKEERKQIEAVVKDAERASEETEKGNEDHADGAGERPRKGKKAGAGSRA